MGKSLVAYFSASGVTKQLAQRLAGVLNADLFEIEPEVHYTKADLNWMDKEARSTVEMNDRASRPEYKGSIDNIDKYDRIFVGFPVWWYREPSIIDTFMEKEDLVGKKVIPFATSGSSQIGDAGKNMQALAPDAKVYEGKRFPADASQEELKAWAEQF